MFVVVEIMMVPGDGHEPVSAFQDVAAIRSTKSAAIARARELAEDLQESNYEDGEVVSLYYGPQHSDENLSSIAIYEEKDGGECVFEYQIVKVTDLDPRD